MSVEELTKDAVPETHSTCWAEVRRKAPALIGRTKDRQVLRADILALDAAVRAWGKLLPPSETEPITPDDRPSEAS